MPASNVTFAPPKTPALPYTAPRRPNVPKSAAQRKQMRRDQEARRAALDAEIQQWVTYTLATVHRLAETYHKKPRYFMDILFNFDIQRAHKIDTVNFWNVWSWSIWQDDPVGPEDRDPRLELSLAGELGDDSDDENDRLWQPEDLQGSNDQEADKENRNSNSSKTSTSKTPKHPLMKRQLDRIDEYYTISPTKKTELIEEYKSWKISRLLGKRPSQKSRAQIVVQGTKQIEGILSSMSHRVGIEAFFCIVRNSADFSMIPQWYFTTPALKSFLESAIKKFDTDNIGVRAEAFSVAGCDMTALICSSKERADFLKAQIRNRISTQLITLTGNSKAVMRYVNYFPEIVERFKLELVGWTHPTWGNPSDLGSSLPPLQKLLAALDNGTCKFVKIRPADFPRIRAIHDARIKSGNAPPETQKKTRVDAGMKRGPNGKKKKKPSEVHEVHDTDLDSDDLDPPHPPKHRQRTTGTSARPVEGCSIITFDTTTPNPESVPSPPENPADSARSLNSDVCTTTDADWGSLDATQPPAPHAPPAIHPLSSITNTTAVQTSPDPVLIPTAPFTSGPPSSTDDVTSYPIDINALSYYPVDFPADFAFDPLVLDAMEF